LLSCVVA